MDSLIPVVEVTLRIAIIEFWVILVFTSYDHISSIINFVFIQRDKRSINNIPMTGVFLSHSGSLLLTSSGLELQNWSLTDLGAYHFLLSQSAHVSFHWYWVMFQSEVLATFTSYTYMCFGKKKKIGSDISGPSMLFMKNNWNGQYSCNRS